MTQEHQPFCLHLKTYLPYPRSMPSRTDSEPATPSQTSFVSSVSRFRWVILGLVFFATTINYLDRMVMGILAPDLQKLYSITDKQYGYIQGAFALSYAFGQLICGGLLDRIGVKVGF